MQALEVRRIINEPPAAALAYGLHQLDRELRAVVLDLGGGTFDVTVLEIIEGVIEIQASAGDARLGGEDFTAELVDLVTDRFAAEHGQRPDTDDPHVRARLLAAAERAKQRLTSSAEARVPLPSFPLAGELHELELILTRAEVEQRWRPLLERIRGPIARALADAKLRADDIDEVVLVGGTTRMPLIVELAPPRPPARRGRRARGRIYPVHDQQVGIDLKIYQGEHSLVRYNTFLGDLYVPLPRTGGADKGIDVRFTYDLNGILEVEALVDATGQCRTLVIEQRPGALTPAEIERARAAMQALKFHPRETLPNRTGPRSRTRRRCTCNCGESSGRGCARRSTCSRLRASSCKR